MADQDRAARAVGEMSGPPCSFVYRGNLPCPYTEAEHGAVLGTLHPYTPLERRTGKDRRGGQVAGDAVKWANQRKGCDHYATQPVSGTTIANPEPIANAIECLRCGAVALAAAPQAAPADALHWRSDPPHDIDEWCSQCVGLPEDEHDTAAPQAAPADGALREALMDALYSLGGGAVEPGEVKVRIEEAWAAIDTALAAADAAPERTLPSVEGLLEQVRDIAKWPADWQAFVWGRDMTPIAEMVLAALRAEATE